MEKGKITKRNTKNSVDKRLPPSLKIKAFSPTHLKPGSHVCHCSAWAETAAKFAYEASAETEAIFFFNLPSPINCIFIERIRIPKNKDQIINKNKMQ